MTVYYHNDSTLSCVFLIYNILSYPARPAPSATQPTPIECLAVYHHGHKSLTLLSDVWLDYNPETQQ